MIRPLDLGLDTPERLVLLHQAVEAGDSLDAFLLTAGLEQLAADFVQRDTWHLGAVARRVFSGAGRLDRTALRASLAVVLLIADARRLRPALRRVEAWRQELGVLVQLLASATVAPGDGSWRQGFDEALARVESMSSRLPERLGRQTARLPACFHAFDLDVADARLMIERFVQRHPDRTRPILVVGVRTSGSYLAPLCAAFLGEAGYESVEVITCRPQRALPMRDRRRIRKLGERGLALVLDDPPVTGSAVDRVARGLLDLGLPLASIVLVLPLFGAETALPERLARYDSVLLPAELWAIAAKLEPAAAAAAIQALLPPDSRTSNPVAVPLPTTPRIRGHRRALIQLAIASRGRRRRSVVVSVEGVGVGYLGRQALVTAEALPDHVPEVLGVKDGCLYRTWLPDAQRAWTPGSEPSDALVDKAAAYFADRRSALAVRRDRSLDMFGEYPVWEAASTMLSSAFGRLALPARVLLFDRLARRLLRVDRPSIVDGATSLTHWFADDRAPNDLVKVDFARDSFSNRGLRSYDAAWDLASAGVWTSTEAADRLRRAYERRIDGPVDDERLFLYELVRLRGVEQLQPADALELERAQARSLQRYISRVHLRGLESPPRGDLCAIDLDGVFETGVFGFQGTTANGALALRALMTHGFRPVIVSGRSIGEVLDRCRAYGLAGGVAEYGSVVQVASDDEPVLLMSRDERQLMDQVRSQLLSMSGVALDESYQHVVRAYVVHGGRRQPVPKSVSDKLVAELGGRERLVTVVGWGQTDFLPATTDKGRGLVDLERRLGGGVALAVGDTISDLPMLKRADLAAAPANAERALRDAGIPVLRRPYQAGLLAAVERLIGHHAGGCDICRPPQLSPSASLVAHALGLGERTGAARVVAAARLRVELAAASRAQTARAT